MQHRGTHYDRDSFKRIVGLADDSDMQKRWKYFLKNIKDFSLELTMVIKEIQKFLEPVFDAIVNETEWQKFWISLSNTWSNHEGGINDD